MSGFVLGVILGVFAGAVGTLLLLLAVYSLPEGDYFRSRVPENWRGAVALVLMILAAGAIFAFLDLRRAAFATSLLLLIVFLAAHTSGMLVSWMTLAVAALVLCLILPPIHNLTIADRQDQVLLGFFVLCGAVGTRLIAHNQKV